MISLDLPIRFHPEHRTARVNDGMAPRNSQSGPRSSSSSPTSSWSALPRAYVVNRVDEAPSSESALVRIGRNSFSPRSEAVVGGSEELTLPNGDRAAGRAEIVRYETEQVEIEAECGSACLLVLTDLLFRGVLLASGSHRVIYRYEPASFRTGILLLLASLVVGSAGLLVLGRVGVRAR